MFFSVRHRISTVAFAIFLAVGLCAPAPVNAQHALLPSFAQPVDDEPTDSVQANGVSLQQQIDAMPVSKTTRRRRPLFADMCVPCSSSRNGLQPKGTWALTVEAVFANFDDPDGLIGSSAAPQSIGPYSSVNLSAIDGDQQVGSSTLVPGLIGQKSSNDFSPGWRAALESRNAYDGGFQIEGMMVFGGDQSWQRGVGGMNAGADLSTVRVGAALPLDVPGGTGYAIPYDQYFKIELKNRVDSISAMYAPAGYYFGTVRVQPTMGFRYLRVDRELNFAGAGSGQAWTANPDGTPDPTSPGSTVTVPYQSELRSSAITNLYGPMIGLNSTTTGNIIRLHGVLRGGLLFADEDVSLGGRGLGNVADPSFDPLFRFSESRSSTNSTLMLESQAGVDIHIFQLMNKLRGSKYASSLVLRLGWSLLYVDQLIKPEDAVRWNGDPSSPSIRRKSSDFTMDSFTAGLVLRY